MPVPILFEDFSESLLPVNIGATQTTIPLLTGTGALFPSPTGGAYFYLQLDDFATNGRDKHECVQVFGRTGDLLTGCVRGVGGTNAQPFFAGDKAELRWNAQSARDIAASATGANALLTYATINPESAGLPNSRQFAASPEIFIVDNGPGSTVEFELVFGSVDNSKLAPMPADTIKGNDAPGPSSPSDLDIPRVIAMLYDFGPSGPAHARGIVPDPGSTVGNTHFLREDGTWSLPPGAGGTVTIVTGSAPVTVSNQTTTPNIFIPNFAGSGPGHHSGLVPDPGSTIGTTRFLREDGTFAVTVSAPAGATTQIQFNNAGALAGDADFTWDLTNNILGIGASAKIRDYLCLGTANRAIGITTGSVSLGAALGVFPNGVGLSARFEVFSESDVANSSKLVLISDSSAALNTIQSFKTGTDVVYDLVFVTNAAAIEAARLDTLGNWSLGLPAPATTATDGFVGLPAMAGLPTGAATVRTGFVPAVVDTTNGRFMGYYAAAWHNLSGGAPSGAAGGVLSGTYPNPGFNYATINAWTKNQSVVPVVIASAGTLNTDASLGNTFVINTLATNATLANPTNLTDGMILNWIFVQDGTGSRTLAYGTDFIFFGGNNVLSTTAGAVDMLTGIYSASLSKIVCQLALAAV